MVESVCGRSAGSGIFLIPAPGKCAHFKTAAAPGGGGGLFIFSSGEDAGPIIE